MQKKTLLRGVFSFFWDIAKVIIISLAIIIPIRYFIVQPFFVRGASMEPAYDQGDYLLVDEVSYRFSDPGRGDVIIFKAPTDTSQFFIKRIVGLPGETVRLRDGIVFITNTEATEEFQLNETYIDDDFMGDLEVTLDDNEYFVLGDNRDASYDSRRWGPLRHDLIVGRVFLRAWPFESFGLVGTHEY